jgi:hypothetical protein
LKRSWTICKAKVKADVAAILNFFSCPQIEARLRASVLASPTYRSRILL